MLLGKSGVGTQVVDAYRSSSALGLESRATVARSSGPSAEGHELEQPTTLQRAVNANDASDASDAAGKSGVGTQVVDAYRSASALGLESRATVAPTYLLLCCAFPVFVFGLWMLYAWLPNFIFEKFGLSLARAALFATVTLQSSMFIGLVAGGAIADALFKHNTASRMWILVASLIGCAPSLYFLGNSVSMVATGAAAVGFGFFGGFFAGNIFPAAFEVVNSDRRASAVGWLNFFGSMLSGFAPLVGGVWKKAIGLEGLLTATACAYILAAVVLSVGVIICTSATISECINVVRILIAECKQEVSTFNPHLSDYADFAMRFGGEVLDYHRSVRNEVGGALSIFDGRRDIELVPSASAFFITSGGTLAEEAWQRIAHELLESIRQAGTVDGVYFCMHGAMASQQELDPEGWLLTETRKIVGANVPVVVSLDLHGILTDRMLQQSDAIVAYHTYPHVDFFETGARAAALLLKYWMASVDRNGQSRYTRARARRRIDHGHGVVWAEHSPGTTSRAGPKGLSAGMFIGNPFTDVPALQTYSFVVTDNDPELACREALRIADSFWDNHERMFVPLKSLAEMQQIALAHQHGTLGLVDAADATSSGASGDSNAVLKALIECGFAGRTLIPIVDAPAVLQAHAAGVGATIRTALGGTLDPARFQPLPVTARVVALGDGRFRSESFGEEWLAGPTAVLQIENFTVVVSSRAVNLYDRSFFYAHQQDPQQFEAVVIKSPHCQPHMYAAWCAQMVNIDAPGSSSANLRYLGHRRCPRPIFPLDPEVELKGAR